MSAHADRVHRWQKAFTEYCRFLPDEDVIACPDCRSTTLRAVAQGNPISRSGWCDFWCDTCLTGMVKGGLPIPDEIVMVTAAFDPRVASIPDYELVTFPFH